MIGYDFPVLDVQIVFRQKIKTEKWKGPITETACCVGHEAAEIHDGCTFAKGDEHQKNGVVTHISCVKLEKYTYGFGTTNS